MSALLTPPDGKILEALQHASEAKDNQRFADLAVRANAIGCARGYDVDFESQDFVKFAWYVAMRLDGTGHRLAEMLAMQQAPFIMTDAVFLEGMTKAAEKAPGEHDYYKAVAEEAGVSVNGKIYHPGLASFPGDPSAWIRGRGDLMAVAEAKNMSLSTPDGKTIRQAREDVEPPPNVDVAPDIVQQRVFDMVEKNPDLAHSDRGELFHDAKQSLLPQPVTVPDEKDVVWIPDED